MECQSRSRNFFLSSICAGFTKTEPKLGTESAMSFRTEETDKKEANDSSIKMHGHLFGVLACC